MGNFQLAGVLIILRGDHYLNHFQLMESIYRHPSLLPRLIVDCLDFARQPLQTTQGFIRSLHMKATALLVQSLSCLTRVFHSSGANSRKASS